MEDQNYTVYIHISPSNKCYVGITSLNPKNRWDSGHGYKQNKYFWSSIKKYGWNNFEHEIISEHLTKQEACNFEILLIHKLKSDDRKFGYNQSQGGDLGCCKYFKEVSSYDLEGNFINNYKSIRQAEKLLNIDHNAISKCCRGILKQAGGYLWRFEQNNNIEIKKTDRQGKICQIDMRDLSVVKIFNSINDVSNLKYNKFDIYKVCEGRQKHHKFYYWCFYKDIENINNLFEINVVKKMDKNTDEIINTYCSYQMASLDNNVSLESIRCACKGIQHTSANYKWISIGIHK